MCVTWRMWESTQIGVSLDPNQIKFWMLATCHHLRRRRQPCLHCSLRPQLSLLPIISAMVVTVVGVMVRAIISIITTKVWCRCGKSSASNSHLQKHSHGQWHYLRVDRWTIDVFRWVLVREIWLINFGFWS